MRHFLFIILPLLFFGCAAPQHKPLSLAQVLEKPGDYQDAHIQISGKVKDSSYKSEEDPERKSAYTFWDLIITDGKLDLNAHAEGYDIAEIEKAVELAKKAQTEKGVATVIGRLRDGVLEIEAFQYNGQTIPADYENYPTYWYSSKALYPDYAQHPTAEKPWKGFHPHHRVTPPHHEAPPAQPTPVLPSK